MTVRKLFSLILSTVLCLCLLLPALAENENAESEFNEIIGADAQAEAAAGDDILVDVPYIDDGSTDHVTDIFGSRSVDGPTPVIVEILAYFDGLLK